MPGTLFVVATPIGNLEDVTARALRVLREVDVIAAEDTRRTARLLARYSIATPSISLHEHNETAKTPALVARLERGESVALVSDAGTPIVSDPGFRLVRAALDAGIRVEPVPGPSAVMAALSASGLPTDHFGFFGFPPTRSKDRKDWLESVCRMTGTVVFFEAPHRIRETLQQLQRTAGDCPVAVARELTKAHEEWVRGPISAVLEALQTPIGEFTVVANTGQTTKTLVPGSPQPTDIAAEVGETAKSMGVPKRKAINVVARRHSMPPNEVYRIVEEAKKSGL
jgi:16S rRNA (cytidine1402-2'-O)-methyltransferase